jgi:hypothetical protein
MNGCNLLSIVDKVTKGFEGIVKVGQYHYEVHKTTNVMTKGFESIAKPWRIIIFQLCSFPMLFFYIFFL